MDATDENADGGRRPAAPDRANAANLFVAAHPGLDLYQFLGVPPAPVEYSHGHYGPRTSLFRSGRGCLPSLQ